MLVGLVSVVLLTLLTLQSGLTQKEGESCVLQHNNNQGVCTPALKCQSGKQDFIDKGIRPTFCSLSNESSLICCKDETSNLNSGNNMNSNPLLDGNNTLRLSERKCKEYDEAMVQTVHFLTLPEPVTMTISVPDCDYNGVELIVGGEDANQGEFPHMVAVGWIDDEDNNAFYCGGSLISSRFVLTAGHCTRYLRLKNPTPSFVRLGDHNLDPHVKDGANPVDIPIKTVHKHPDYKPPSRYNDIALLELNEDVAFNRYIKPACLWTKSDFSSSRGLATFWEAHGIRSKEQSANGLQKVSLSLLENDDCEKLLKGTQNIREYRLLPSQVCGTPFLRRKDSCWGQSGSPLQIMSRENSCIRHIVGVTILGHRCPQSGRPAVYTRVSSYLDWIESIVWPGE